MDWKNTLAPTHLDAHIDGTDAEHTGFDKFDGPKQAIEQTGFDEHGTKA